VKTGFFKKRKRSIDISIVIPVYNEEENIIPLYSAVKGALDNLDKTYEVIFIDDGSTDKTFKLLKRIRETDPQVKVIKFRGNFGQSAAMAAGFEKAQGRVVISMDGDLQNDPRDIPNLLKKLEEGYDLVSGWRKDRKDNLLLRKIPSWIANHLICSVTKVKLHDTGCSLKAYRSELIKRVRLYGELHRFIPALAKLEGARIAEIVVTHHPRRFGKSKYNLTRTFKVLMDLLTLNLFLRYFRNPLHFFGFIGVVSFFLGSLTAVVMAWNIFQHIPLENINILLIITFLLLINGFQFFLYGLLANLIKATADRKPSGYFGLYTTNLSNKFAKSGKKYEFL